MGRPLATVREELVGTVGGSGTFSATRVASWIRHVATACAKGIAKNKYLLADTYLPMYLLVCLLARPPSPRVEGSRVWLKGYV